MRDGGGVGMMTYFMAVGVAAVNCHYSHRTEEQMEIEIELSELTSVLVGYVAKRKEVNIYGTTSVDRVWVLEIA